MRREDGSLSVFVVIVTMALLLTAALVLDGGRLLAARRQAADIAGNAARAGVQAVDEHELRSGRAIVDPVDGHDAVAAYLASTPATGTTRITGDTVTVDVRMRVEMLLLGLAGVGDPTVTASRQARAATGVSDGGP
ncbi:MAG TPA: pilus assembly protein TadG-related protein [Euzebyales bacterium]|nr:pilus assembly protein TadG-related protein [Euzebyales bacterium]